VGDFGLISGMGLGFMNRNAPATILLCELLPSDHFHEQAAVNEMGGVAYPCHPPRGNDLSKVSFAS